MRNDECREIRSRIPCGRSSADFSPLKLGAPDEQGLVRGVSTAEESESETGSSLRGFTGVESSNLASRVLAPFVGVSVGVSEIGRCEARGRRSFLHDTSFAGPASSSTFWVVAFLFFESAGETAGLEARAKDWMSVCDRVVRLFTLAGAGCDAGRARLETGMVVR